MNTVNLIGNLTRDPQMRFTPGGMAVAEVGVAINERRKVGNEWRDAPVFVDITLFGKTAETASQHLHKGDRIGVTGKLQLDSWDDKLTGQRRTKLKVVGDRLHFMANKSQEDQTPVSQSYGEEPQVAPSENDECPF